MGSERFSEFMSHTHKKVVGKDTQAKGTKWAQNKYIAHSQRSIKGIREKQTDRIRDSHLQGERGKTKNVKEKKLPKVEGDYRTKKKIEGD